MRGLLEFGSWRARLCRQEERRRARDTVNRELAAEALERRGYAKVAAKIRAGMRSSSWTEDLVDPGLLLDLLETIKE